MSGYIVVCLLFVEVKDKARLTAVLQDSTVEGWWKEVSLSSVCVCVCGGGVRERER